MKRIPGSFIPFLVLIVLASSMRTGHFLSIDNDPIADTLFLDCKAYDTQAVQWASTGNPFSGPYFQTPLYPFLLSRIYRLFGHDYDYVRILQMILDVISVGLIFSLTVRVFGIQSAVAAGAVMALYPVLIFESGLILKTTLSIFLFALTLWSLVMIPFRNGWIKAVVSGAIAGLAAVNQGSFLLLIPLYLLWLFMESPGFVTGMRNCSVFGFAFIVSIAPITYHNWRTSGDVILLTTQGGANFYLGNSPYSDGTSKRPPRVRMTPEHEEADFHREAERALGRELSQRESSAYWSREAWRWIREHPGDAVRLQMRKLGLFWNKVEIPDNHDFDFYRRYSMFMRYPRYPFTVLVMLGMPGLVFCLIQARRNWLFPALTLTYCLIVVSFHVYSRYRLPVVVPLAMLAGFGLDRLIAFIQLKQTRSALTWILISVTAVWVSSIPLTGYSHSQPLFNLGVGLMHQGKLEEAARAFEDALVLTPDYTDALTNLGKIAYLRGQFGAAESLWSRVLELAPGSEEAMSNLGTLAVDGGRIDEAENWFRKAVDSQPYYFLGWLHLGQILLMQGRSPEAVTALERAIDLEPTHPQTLFMLAQALDQSGDPRALSQWRRYVDIAAGISSEATFIGQALDRIRQLEQTQY